MIPWHIISCGTVFEKEAPIKATATSGRLAQSEYCRARGHFWKAPKNTGIVRYIIPVDVVPIAAIPPGFDANGSLVV